ncbi:toxin-antitoxin system HicB family antitoxin [Janthinobacterium lividum]|uniref:toxin-antitoxin system HicB family antitoxin n=1 Tax=Janthinobacterium lividum TaxID=29581 RepID=UPI001594EF5E|nr:toxin-antitoxin system HicB family antitoxin [Janthinobacterium lividum]QKY08778.1 toxin-antitoxin system HicB family antitoxin [Janthinobacterium lividum]
MSVAPKTGPFGLRMPEDLKKWVAAEAVKDQRSTNNFIVVCLEQIRAERKQQQNAQ